MLSFTAAYCWKDEQANNCAANNFVMLPSYGLLNGRLEYRPRSGNWSVALF